MNKKRVLITAFKGEKNASFQLVSGMKGEKLYLTNSYEGLERDIAALEDCFDAVIMFGVDKDLRDRVRIETCAQLNGETLDTSFCVDRLEQVYREKQITCTISHKPTSYFCNAAYYYMLKKICNTIFIHIPSMKWMNLELMESLRSVDSSLEVISGADH